jgi:hypothetical protein
MNDKDLIPTPGKGVPSSDLFGLPWVGELSHDRSQNADWGVLRDERGHWIYQCGAEKGTQSDYAAECRRNGTDPCQSRVDALMLAFKALSLMDWTETLLCNAEHPKHCTAEEWNKLVHEWRELRPRLPNLQAEGRGSDAPATAENGGQS